MSPARWPRASPLDERLLIVDPHGRFETGRVGDLPGFVCPGDLFVFNDAATLPASLRGTTASGEPLEARLLSSQDGTWRAVLFGAGDWRTRTENRAAPPSVRAGDRLSFGTDLVAHVEAVASASERLVDLRFESKGARFWSALYRLGRPVQYAHLAAPLALWHVQTPFASRPWASEMPSAGRPLAWELLLALRARGAAFASITHAAGLSATGDPRVDRALPLRESFEVPFETATSVARARADGRRVVAVGTSVVRALESAARLPPEPGGSAARGETELVIDAEHELLAVDALFTGMHEPGTSHDALLRAFLPPELLERAYAAADAEGFVGHEFGDSMFVARGAAPASSS